MVWKCDLIVLNGPRFYCKNPKSSTLLKETIICCIQRDMRDFMCLAYRKNSTVNSSLTSPEKCRMFPLNLSSPLFCTLFNAHASYLLSLSFLLRNSSILSFSCFNSMSNETFRNFESIWISAVLPTPVSPCIITGSPHSYLSWICSILIVKSNVRT